MSEDNIIINVTKITPISKPLMPSPWQVYMARCSDGSLYTGVTTDIPRRIYEHNNTKKGSKYCRSRRPVELVYRQGDFESRAHAQQREREIKLLSKKEKEELVYWWRWRWGQGSPQKHLAFRRMEESE